MSEVAVVGGGFAGLAAAGLLARDGHEVTLLERHERLGGRSGRWSADGFTFDTGPSWYLMPEVIERWFTLMGSSVDEHLQLRRLDPAYRVFFEDHPEAPVEVVSGRDESAALFERLDPGSGPALQRYLDSAAEAYGLAKEHFLYTDFHRLADLATPAVLRRAPKLAGLLGSSLQSYVHRRFREPRQRQLLGYPAVFLGTSPDRAPAMYHLMSHLDLTDGVFYPLGGFAALVDAMTELVRQAGVRVVTGAEVTGIQVAPSWSRRRRGRAARSGSSGGGPGGRLSALGARSGIAGARLPGLAVSGVRYRGAGAPEAEAAGGETSEQVVEADVVVAAADLHHVQTQLLPAGLRAPESRWRRRDPGPSGVLVCLGVQGRLPELAHHNLFFTADWEDNFSRIASGRPLREETSVYVSKTSATDSSTAPAGDENLFILVPAPAVPEWGRGGLRTAEMARPGSARVEQVADAAIEQVGRWAGIEDLAARARVRRTYGPADFSEKFSAWRGSLLGPGHTLAQSAMFRPGVTDRRIAGLFYAGSSVQPGIGVPMCLISSEVVRTAIRRAGTGPMASDRSEDGAGGVPGAVTPRAGTAGVAE